MIKINYPFFRQKYFEYHNKLSNISTNSKNLESCIEILENETIENKNNSARIDSAWKNLAKIFIKLTEIPKKWETLVCLYIFLIISLYLNFKFYFILISVREYAYICCK